MVLHQWSWWHFLFSNRSYERHQLCDLLLFGFLRIILLI